MNVPARPTLVRPFIRRAAAGAEPGVFRVDPHAPAPRIEFFACGHDHCESRIVANVDDLPALIDGHSLCWINIDGLGDGQVIRRLGDIFQIHALTLEDVVHVHQRAKVEEYPEYLFIVMRMVWLGEALQSEQISLVLKDRLIVTFQETPGDCLEVVRKRLRDERSPLRTMSTDRLAYAIMDAVVDGYFPVIEEFGEWIETTEQVIPQARGPRIIGEIHQLRQELLFLRRCVWPLRETLNILLRDQTERFSAETQLHLRDAYDHTVQLMDVVETYREMCADLRDFYYAVVSQRTNAVMKVLTIVATIFMPLGFITGVYGMNFDTARSPWNMPELRWAFGYPFALGLMGATTGGMLWFFHKRGWLRADDPEDE